MRKKKLTIKEKLLGISIFLGALLATIHFSPNHNLSIKKTKANEINLKNEIGADIELNELGNVVQEKNNTKNKEQ